MGMNLRGFYDVTTLIKKYFTQICFVRCVIDLCPCFSYNIALMLSCNMIILSTVKPCSLVK